MEKIQKKSGHNRSVDFMKGMCILFVITAHCDLGREISASLLFPFWIHLPVSVFMLLSGYVYALSYQRHSIDSFKKAYAPSQVLPKFARYLEPYIPVFIAEVIILTVMGDYNLNLMNILVDFVTGGRGRGSYYVPLMIQFIFWFPVVHAIIKKFDLAGVFICGGLVLTYEALKNAIGMTEDCYRLILIRYTLVIAVGCYLAIGKKRTKKQDVFVFIMLFLSMIIGAAYIVWVYYFGYNPVLTKYWKETSIWASLFIIPPTVLIIGGGKLKWAPLEFLGKASYHIFMLQMFYFKPMEAVYEKLNIPFLTFPPIKVLTAYTICITAGILYYFLDNKLHRLKKRKVQSAKPKE